MLGKTNPRQFQIKRTPLLMMVNYGKEGMFPTREPRRRLGGKRYPPKGRGLPLLDRLTRIRPPKANA